MYQNENNNTQQSGGSEFFESEWGRKKNTNFVDKSQNNFKTKDNTYPENKK